MKTRLILIAALLFSAASLHADCQKIPECISNFCLHVEKLDNLPTEQQVRKLLGSNRQATPSFPHRRSSCHLVSTPKYKEIYINLTFMPVDATWNLITVAISSQKLCSDPESLSVDFEFLTDGKVGLGNSAKDITDVHGKPTYLLKPPPATVIKDQFPFASQQPADTVIQYASGDDELLTTRFFMLKGKVVGIELSADE